MLDGDLQWGDGGGRGLEGRMGDARGRGCGYAGAFTVLTRKPDCDLVSYLERVLSLTHSFQVIHLLPKLSLERCGLSSERNSA